MSTGWESRDFQSATMAAVKRQISTLLGEFNAVFRLVARHCNELYFTIALGQQQSVLNLHLSTE